MIKISAAVYSFLKDEINDFNISPENIFIFE
jgi:hypothetical protein